MKIANPLLLDTNKTSTQFLNRPMTANLMTEVEIDKLSQSRGAYVGKRSKQGYPRLYSASSSKIKLSNATKTFYPEKYFKRVGYQKSEASSKLRVNPLG